MENGPVGRGDKNHSGRTAVGATGPVTRLRSNQNIAITTVVHRVKSSIGSEDYERTFLFRIYENYKLLRLQLHFKSVHFG